MKAMYEGFFGMTQTPFLRCLPVDALYADHEIDEMVNRLIYAADKQQFAVLVGESGAGKTTILRRLRAILEKQNYIVLYITDSDLTPRHFYNEMLEQLGGETHKYRMEARKELHRQIDYMRAVENKKVVVIVDESHLLSKETLEEIRFLLNYKMDSENPLALILCGQQELWERMKKKSFRAIRNRIDIVCSLKSYDLAQTKQYIERQMEYSGHPSPVFSDDAIKAVYEFSAGIPRLVNWACTQSLIYAYQQQHQIIDDKMVRFVLESEGE